MCIGGFTDRNVKKMGKVLFVSYRDFHSSYEGGSQANKRNWQQVCNVYGVDNVDCFYVNDVTRKRSILDVFYAILLFPFGYFNGLTPGKVNEIVKSAVKYECIFISTSVFGLVAKKLKESGYNGKVISFFHNVESVYFESRVPKKLPMRGIIINCAVKNEKYSLENADVVVGLCGRDDNLLRGMYGRGFDAFAPISFVDKCRNWIPDEETLTSAKPKCVFIGSNFPANSQGVLWFVKNVLPHVNVDFTIVGQNMEKLQRENDCLKNIKVFSSVPDLTPYFREADFMVFPIFEGSGMKVKTCEAMMYGKNIIGTTETFEGYDVDPDMCGRLCNTAVEYIEAIRAFCDNPIPRYNKYSRKQYVEKYSEKRVSNVFRSILR